MGISVAQRRPLVTPGEPVAATAAQTAAATVAWYTWCLVAAVVSVIVGGYWDISWHMSIGRDSFWTPPHMLIYACGALAGISCGYLIFSTTWNPGSPLRGSSVTVWGFRAPLGAFIAAWGGVVMLVSAPFDNWWHNAYGLDVKILSPPHTVLDLGVIGVEAGSLVLVAGAMNRSEGALRRKLTTVFLGLGAALLVLAAGTVWEYANRGSFHSARSYEALAIAVPLVIFGAARPSGHRWALTIVTGLYTTYSILMLWILPRFPAEPKLGPVYQPITHFVPMEFPFLVIAPALAIDWLWPHFSGWKKAWQAAALGSLFLVIFVAVQWPFADFLMSPASRNWVFGTGYLPYIARPNSRLALYQFSSWDATRADFWLGMARAWLFAVISARLGMGWGDWVRRVRR
jgi:hypothetical protein